MDTLERKTILIVDDEPAICELLTVLLSSHGYLTKTASTGREALKLMSSGIDLVLLDLVLPDIEGIEVCQKLKSDLHTKDIPIIVISGKPNKPERIESLYLGAEDYVSKPFEPEELFARMDVALRRHIHQDTLEHQQNIGELKRIIDQESIHVRFQPIYFLNSKRLLGFEMLSCPQTSTPLSNPENFFKAALKYGVYYEVEMIGWRKAIKTASEIFDGRQKLFLNCDPNMLEVENFRPIKDMFSHYGFSSQEVFLEVTERSAIIAFDVFYQKLGQYRRDGFKIAVDDMGAGYTSLESMVEIKPEAVKLDKRLIIGIHTDPYKRSIVRLFVTFCRENNIICIAEGIENKEDLRTLVDLGVDAGQGYYLYRPTEIINLSAMASIGPA